MSKATKKKNKVPKITEEQYAEYISALKSATQDTDRLSPERNAPTDMQEQNQEHL